MESGACAASAQCGKRHLRWSGPPAERGESRGAVTSRRQNWWWTLSILSGGQ